MPSRFSASASARMSAANPSACASVTPRASSSVSDGPEILSVTTNARRPSSDLHSASGSGTADGAAARRREARRNSLPIDHAHLEEHFTTTSRPLYFPSKNTSLTYLFSSSTRQAESPMSAPAPSTTSRQSALTGMLTRMPSGTPRSHSSAVWPVRRNTSRANSSQSVVPWTRCLRPAHSR